MKIDVSNFSSKNLNVKVVEDDKIMIGGSYQKYFEDSPKIQKFNEYFEFPGVNENSKIITTLSKDSILTIIVEKLVNTNILFLN